MFQGVSPKVLETYRQRVSTKETYEILRHPVALRYTLLAAFCLARQQKIIDTLVELLTDTVHHIQKRAENRVAKFFLADLRRVSGKNHLLFQLAEAALAQPEGIACQVLFPVVDEQTLRDLVKEYQVTRSAYQQKVYAAMRSSYRAHYRQGLPAILKALTFCSNHQIDQSLLDALKLLQRDTDASSRQAFFAPDDEAPLDGIVPAAWRDMLVKSNPEGKEQIKRIDYEISVLHTLREKLRCKDLWVKGAKRFCNPEEDLPGDFADQRTEYYLGKARLVKQYVSNVYPLALINLECALTKDIPTDFVHHRDLRA